VAAHDLPHAQWRKSSYSANSSTCVEVTASLPGIIAVRDSQDPAGPALAFSPADWQALITTLRHTPQATA
jgi:hypothetical protein